MPKQILSHHRTVQVLLSPASIALKFNIGFVAPGMVIAYVVLCLVGSTRTEGAMAIVQAFMGSMEPILLRIYNQ